MRIYFFLFACLFLFGRSNAQEITVRQAKNIDSLNIQTSRAVARLLSEGSVDKAFQLFRPLNPASTKKALARISRDLQPFKTKTNLLVEVSYRNYRDSFNINRVVFYNSEGQYYLFELFYRIEDNSSRILDLFIKDPATLARNRRRIAEFKKKNPDVPQPPNSLPPGVYIKERN